MVWGCRSPGLRAPVEAVDVRPQIIQVVLERWVAEAGPPGMRVTGRVSVGQLSTPHVRREAFTAPAQPCHDPNHLSLLPGWPVTWGPATDEARFRIERIKLTLNSTGRRMDRKHASVRSNATAS